MKKPKSGFQKRALERHNYYRSLRSSLFRVAFKEQEDHFTELIWEATTHMGMAYTVTGKSAYVMTNYLPPGNVIGKFPDNVLLMLE
ncbi:golgi-associated plant pathogenesis-related protein 1-like [Tropilaelaps mercedesae]|uniref:Golgi-associated plant pathogenesis-related protein 1-like n=1 Tax=Tropilaelaps mercedesae TaxID=418985 RepID=A0A1V9Y051_9ACAR|nr:golgi-associated plant pathogenesis-related protein 1-like [Tropilaelaps mercedesae]